MSETKPTAWALRAAEIIGDIVIQTPEATRHDLAALIPMLKDGFPSRSSMVWTVAQIIDRETAGPKVEELVLVVKEYTQHAAKPPWESKPFDHDAWLERAEKAIREVEAALKGSAQ